MKEILKFKGVKEDVYNSTGPFLVNGKKYLAGRVEKRNVFWREPGYSPKIMFFFKNGGSWVLDKNAPVFNMMEDPFKTFINGELILGGVEVFGENEKFRTVFMKGRCPWSLKRFAVGPDMMKDIRLVELPNNKIGVFTRPQRNEYKRGRIGFIIINNLKDLTKENILKAKIIRDNLKENEWEGVNDAKLLKNGKIGVIAHKARINKKGEKKYVATSFVFNPKNLKYKNDKVIARRKDFLPSPAKEPLLDDIVFPGELVDFSFLYAGIADASQQVKKIENPFPKEFII